MSGLGRNVLRMTLSIEDGLPVLDLAMRLELARRAAGYTQATFAPTIGFDKGTISDFERGARAPKRGTLIAWSQLTGVSLSWLETGVTAPDGDGGDVVLLPRLDSNQQPSGYRPVLLAAA